MSTQKTSLLLIHDRPQRRKDIGDFLRVMGYQVEECTSELETVPAAPAGPHAPPAVDVILWGMETADLFRTRASAVVDLRKRLRTHALIVFAPGARTEELAQMLDLGADECIVEPLHPKLLDVRIRACQERLRLRERLARDEATIRKLMHDLQHVILPIGMALSIEKDHNRLLERILEEAKRLCNADAGTLYLRTEDDRLAFTIVRTDSLGIALGGTTGREIAFPPLRMYDEETRAPNDHNIATHVALTGKAVNIPDIYASQDFDWSATKRFDRRNNYRSVSTLTVPLKNNVDEVIGVLQLFNSKDPASGMIIPFDHYQQLVFESLASQASVVLSNQALIRREQELLRYERDLQIGHDIQVGFMPREWPKPRNWEVSALFLPAQQVAGDFYDVFALDSGRVAFVVADVCDKGVGAALFGALTRSLIRAFTQQCVPGVSACTNNCDPCKTQLLRKFLQEYMHQHGIESTVDLANPMCALNMTNDYITTVHGDMNMYVTLFFGLVDPESCELTYINAGHEAPVLLDRQGQFKQRLKNTGPAVGIMPHMKFRAATVHLDPEDILFVYTDGVTDARNEAGAFFSHERLDALLHEPAGSAADLQTRIAGALKSHIGAARQFDDITMMVVRRALQG